VYGWWEVSVPFLTRLLDRLSSVLVDTEQIQEALERQQQLADEEMPLMFVDVASAQASTEKPDNPRFYGAFNSQAASVEANEQDQELPKIDGEQDKEFKTFDVPRETPQAASQAQQPVQVAALEPAPEPVAIDADQLQPTPEPEAKPAGQPDAPVTPLVETKATEPGSPEDLSVRTPVTPKPGDLVRATVKTQPERGDGAVRRGDNGEAVQPPRPRTIAQARAQLPQETGIVGQKMQTDGGSRMQRVMPSFNTEGTIWGQYDAKLVAIIKSRWYRYLDQHPEAFNWAGRVAVRFQLHYDGRVTNYEVLENNSGEMQGYGAFKAIMGDAGEPYDPWPPSLRRSTAKDFRELRFTFYYN
jgi:outer membrane biosynthesis protein TonB